MKIEQISRTVHAVKLDKQPQRMLFISDVHYDSVKCDRVMRAGTSTKPSGPTHPCSSLATGST